MTIDVTFLDSGHEPREKPDPAYPNGRDIRLCTAVQKSCGFNVPYPAPRCGVYSIKCSDCGIVVAVTVAGRPDDPRTVTIPCKTVLHS